MKKTFNSMIYIVVIAILVVFNLWLLVNGRITAARPDISNALERIVKLNPNMAAEHDEHLALVLQNGDMIEFTKNIALSDADVVMVINADEIDEGIVNLKNVDACPPPGEKLENGKFCYVPAEILAGDEPHLAEEYPKGILLRPFDIK